MQKVEASAYRAHEVGLRWQLLFYRLAAYRRLATAGMGLAAATIDDNLLAAIGWPRGVGVGLG